MENISKFPDRKVIEQEAADWLIKLDGDEPPGQEDLKALTEWLSRSPVHREELNSLNHFWANNILTELVVPLGKQEPQPGLEDEPQPGFEQQPQLGLFSVMAKRLLSAGGFATAAAVGGLAIALGIWFTADPLSDTHTHTNGIYLTAVGQQKSFRLADGSMVQLNTNSQIEVEYNDQHRNVVLLQGEAHFEIIKDPNSPFRVYAGASRVQAVGTAFTVYLKDKGVNVLVTEGSVALVSLGMSQLGGAELSISDANTEVYIDPYVNSQSQTLGILKAGESVTLDIADANKDSQQVLHETLEVIDEDELHRRQSWREGLLVFSGEPLEQVVMEISRYTTVSIEINDRDLRQIQIGGRFKVGDIDNMLNALEANFGLQVERLNYNRVQLKAAE